MFVPSIVYIERVENWNEVTKSIVKPVYNVIRYTDSTFCKLQKTSTMEKRVNGSVSMTQHE